MEAVITRCSTQPYLQVANFYQRVAGPFRELGLQAGLLYGILYALRPLNPFAAFFVYELVEQAVAPLPTLQGRHATMMRWHEVHPGSPEIERMPPAAAVKQARFDQGARCIAVYRNDDFIGYVWFGFGRYVEDEVRCVYQLKQPASAVFDFDLYIFPAYRLGRAFAMVWDAANEFLKANGAAYTYSRISRFNLASRQAHLRLGARVVGQASFLVIGPVQMSWSRLYKGLPLRFTVAGRPVMLL